jgi:AraC-like DNA-binding protein
MYNKDANGNLSAPVVRIGKYTAEKLIHVESVDTLFYFEFNDHFKDKLEEHPAWEMIYADKGQCNIVADDNEFTLEQGELYFHKPYEKHMLSINKNDYPNIIIMSFQCSSPAMRFFENRKLAASLQTKQYIATMIHEASLTFERSPGLKISGSSLVKGNKLWAGEQTVLLRLELMLIELVREHALVEDQKKLFVSKELADDPLCTEIIEFMEENLYGRLDMLALCEKVNFSASYVSRYFKRVCGHPISHYYNMMKIEEAKRLIRQTHLSFFEISERLMITNSHYFSTLFRNHVGMTPTQYKKSCK